MAGAFILTLAFSLRHYGAWGSLVAVGAVASHPFGPPPAAVATPTAAALPAAAATNPPSDNALPQTEQSAPQSEPSSAPDVDNGEMLTRRDRAAAHGSRTR